jgi:hypothetical protein
MHVAKTKISLGKEDVPRALLLRCWERAVHATSKSIHVPVEAKIPLPESPDSDSSEDESVVEAIDKGDDQKTGEADQEPPPTTAAAAVPQTDGQQAESLFSREAAVAKCKEWRIHLPLSTPHSCLRCKIEFSTQNELDRHFFGYRNVKGCCWVLIHAKYHFMIGNVLQQQVRSQTDQLLDLIMKEAVDKVGKHFVFVAAQKRKKRREKGKKRGGAQMYDLSRTSRT